MSIVYEISVNCMTTYDSKRIQNRKPNEIEPYISYYQSVLKIYRKKHEHTVQGEHKVQDVYEVWVTVRELTMFCKTFKTLREAEQYVNRTMKLVMWGQFVYKNCYLCGKKVYYPEAFCNDCRVIVYPMFSGWFVETENEKISQHLSFSRPSWKLVAPSV